MPPRKRARLSQAASPSATTPEPAIAPSNLDILSDAWTDEEETGLFKGLIKWKPTGVHKHFRMLQLREYLLENNYIHHKSEHTQISGIWEKLSALYDLEALDQREDARQLSDISDDEGDDEDEEMEDIYSIAQHKVHKQIFELPEDDYGEEMWQHRLASAKEQRDESPPVLPELNLADKAPVKFKPSFSVEPEEAPATKSRGGRQSRGTAKAKPVGRRSMRKGGSVTAESEEPGSEEEEDSADDSEEVEEEDENEEVDEEASETGAPATRGRGRGRGRSRGRPRGRRR